MRETTQPAPDGGAVEYVVEAQAHGPVVDRLIEQAFGPGRMAKAAERLREGNQPVAELCYCAVDAGAVAGAVRLWPIRIGDRPALFLGPIVVDPAWQSRGLGAELVERVCDKAKTLGHELVLLVGDHSFFGPLGFVVTPSGAVAMPGPVNPQRLLWRELQSGAAEGCRGEARVQQTR